ncbi:hypothetical protein TSUD_378510 [Trifolium subterraneum]|uniref:PROP1-like PPR domain-containing protein n=1 Tax=Trifolium subterraneum TaxID=3900 RepID=A0A2Z6NSY2_TRISU|nr:hypothetical protein TSUD_378510 [Trifolium subterraneum]
MAQPYPLCSFINPKFPNFNHTFKTFFSYQPHNSLHDKNLNHPVAKISSLSKTKIRVNPKTLTSKPIKPETAISSLKSCDANEQQVSQILSGLGGSVKQSYAEYILNNISNPETAILALKYFQQKIVPKNHVILYNALFKLFWKIKDFKKAQKLFDEMLQRGVKPNTHTFQNLIRCAALCSLPHKSVELFERMPSYGCKQDCNVASSMIYVYARIGNVDMALKLYDNAKKEKWDIKPVAFSALIKMYGILENDDACLSVYNDMKVLGVKPDMILYNALLYAMGRAARVKDANDVYVDMRKDEFKPNWATYSALLEAYSRGRLSDEALSVYKEMKKKGMTLNKFLYRSLIDMCADIGYIDEAVEIFEDMKRSGTCKPNNFIYSSLIKLYACNGNILEAEAMLNEMINCGLKPNVLVLTMLVQCYGNAKRTDDVVNIFNQFWDVGITPNDELCDSLLYVMTQIPKEELGKITNCIEKANPKLGYIVTYLMEEKEDDGYFIMNETSELLSSADEYVKKSLCNSLIDICYNLGMKDRARDLLDLGLLLEIYSDLQLRSETQWCLNLKKLSVGAAMTALHVWLDDLTKVIESGEELPQVLAICTFPWKRNHADKALASVFESNLKELNFPFDKATNKIGWFFTTSQDAKSWLQSRGSTETVADLNSTVLDVLAGLS